ncbi:MAG: SUMF1/EgtB/PvdO family nonheme iron enzyme [Myxococcota bacterium]
MSRLHESLTSAAWCVVVVVALIASGCLPPLSRQTKPGPDWPDLADVPDGSNEGRRDAAVVVALDDPELGGRPGARAVADAWARELVHRQGVPARRVWLVRNRRATPTRVLRILERAKRRVPVGGSIWFVFIGRGNTPSTDAAGHLRLAPDRKGDTLDMLKVWASIGFGPQHSAFAVLDACDDSPAAGHLGGLPALRMEMRGDAVDTITISQRDRADLAFRLPEGPMKGGPVSLAVLMEQVKTLARQDGIKQRVRPASTVSMSAGIGPQCAATLPAGDGPALSYAMLGALRGWADDNDDALVTAEEATRYAGTVIRHAWSPGLPVPSPEAAGVNMVLSRSSGLPAPDLDAIIPAASTLEDRAALPPLRFDFTPERHVPAGRFTMGCAGHGNCEDDAEGKREVMVYDFTMDQTEVTWNDYADCVEAGACTALQLDDCYAYQEGEGFVLGGGIDPATITGEHPVTCVNWVQANAYCDWQGARLPREAEWEKAARGTDGRLYPWGDEAPTCEFANHNGCAEGPTSVGQHPDGASPYGMQDMAGNVWEWVEDWYQEDAYARTPRRRPPPLPDRSSVKVVRGGSFYDEATDLRASYRYGLTPTMGYSTVGFRCAR